MKTMWKFLSGKKTIIAAIASQVLIWVQVKGYLDFDTVVMLAGILVVWTGVAVGHKAAKAGK